MCDRPYFANGDGLSSLDRAEQKCGGQSPFAFIKESDDGKKSGGSGGSSVGGSTFLEDAAGGKKKDALGTLKCFQV